MKPLKVLFQIRPTIHSLPGGDVVQMNKTRTYLEKLGIKVDISTELRPDVIPYDLVHVFNLETPSSTIIQIKNAKRRNKPVILTPNYLYLPDKYRFFSFYQFGRYSIAKKALPKSINYKIHRLLFNKEIMLEKQILELVDLVLPNSETEMKQLTDFFGLLTLSYFTVTNAVDPTDFKDPNPQNFIRRFGVKDYILEVGRVNMVKNQINLIKAMQSIDIPLVIVGQNNEKSYYKRCLKETKKCQKVIFIPQTAQSELKDIYAAAKVHVLPSYKENTGLVSLEAALCGCNLVASTFGCQTAYLHEFAEYCEPDKPESIRTAILRAYNKPNKHEFSNYIKNHYTWEKAAQQTLDAYKHILKQ